MPRDEIQQLKDQLSRREWLELVGSTAIVGSLAGCTGDGDQTATPTPAGDGDGDGMGDQTDTPSDDGDGEDGIDFPPDVDTPLKVRFSTEPGKAQWNPYNTRSQVSYGWPFLQQPAGWFSTFSGEFVPWVAEDWEWLTDGEHFRFHLGDFWTYHDGTPLTAQDVRTRLMLAKFLGGSDDIIDTVEVVDDYTVDIHTPETIANFVLELRLFTRGEPDFITTTPHHIYGDMLAAIEDSEPDTDARDEALAAVADYRFKPAIGTGAWQQKEVQSGRIVLEPFEEFPITELRQQIEDSDKIDYEFPDWVTDDPNYPEVHLEFFTDASSVRQAWFTNKLDTGSDSPPEDMSIVNQYPDTLTMTLRPTYRGSCIAFKLDHPVYQHREIRRAMAYAMDVESIASTTYGVTGFPNRSASGLPKALADLHLPEEFLENTLTSYVAQDYDAARAEMQSLVDANSDFGQSGGNWTFEGEPIRITLSAPAVVQSHINSMRQLVSWLQDIGFKAEVRGVEGVQFWTQTMPNGDYTVTQNYFGGAQPHPYYAYRNTWLNGFLINETHSPPQEVTAPPIGESSGSKTYPVADLTSELATPISDERQQEILETLAWVWNQTLPYVPYAERHNMGLQNHRRFHWPHPDDKITGLQRGNFMMNNLGTVIGRKNQIDEFPYDPRYLSIEGNENPGGMTLEEAKSQVPKRDESW